MKFYIKRHLLLLRLNSTIISVRGDIKKGFLRAKLFATPILKCSRCSLAVVHSKAWVLLSDLLIHVGWCELVFPSQRARLAVVYFKNYHMDKGKRNKLQQGKSDIRKKNSHSEGGQILEQGPEELQAPHPWRCSKSNGVRPWAACSASIAAEGWTSWLPEVTSSWIFFFFLWFCEIFLLFLTLIVWYCHMNVKSTEQITYFSCSVLTFSKAIWRKCSENWS